jgi:DNA repair exonuclease SbcCD ATPase subunit
MNISHEFFKIRDAFRKVKLDMDYLRDILEKKESQFLKEYNLLKENIDLLKNDFKKNHQKLKEEIDSLKDLKEKSDNENSNLDPSELNYLKEQLLELKNHIKEIEEKNQNFYLKISKKEKEKEKKIEDKLKSTELELYLLKQKLDSHDTSIESIKEVTRNLFDIVEDITRIEKDIVEIKKGDLPRTSI